MGYNFQINDTNLVTILDNQSGRIAEAQVTHSVRQLLLEIDRKSKLPQYQSFGATDLDGNAYTAVEFDSDQPNTWSILKEILLYCLYFFAGNLLSPGGQVRKVNFWTWILQKEFRNFIFGLISRLITLFKKK